MDSARSIVAGWSKTQSRTVSGQLNDGIRYLDLRVSYNSEKNGFYYCHGMYGPALLPTFEDILAFVTANPREILVLDFNHFYAMDDTSTPVMTRNSSSPEKTSVSRGAVSDTIRRRNTPPIAPTRRGNYLHNRLCSLIIKYFYTHLLRPGDIKLTDTLDAVWKTGVRCVSLCPHMCP